MWPGGHCYQHQEALTVHLVFTPFKPFLAPTYFTPGVFLVELCMYMIKTHNGESQGQEEAQQRDH